MAAQPSADGGAMKAPQQLLVAQHAPLGGTARSERPWRPLPQSWEARHRVAGALRARGSDHGYPFDSDPLDKRFPSVEGLPLSLYTPFDGLPPDGKTQTEREMSCDPMHQMCQTPTYVYEDECSLCNGTGQMESKEEGRLYSCTLCNGLGYVRRTTTRFIPDVNGSGPMMTLNRSKELQKELPRHLRNGGLRTGFKEKPKD